MTTPTTERPRLYIPGGHQLTLNLVQQGQEAAVVLGAVVLDGGLMASQWFATWRDAAWSAFRPLCTTEVSCMGATGRFVNEPSGQVVEMGAPPSNAGTNAATGAVASASTLIKWATSSGGRSAKGRTFLPALPTTAIASGGRVYSTAHGGLVNTAVTSYLAASCWTADVRPAVLSFTKGEAYPITTGAISPIIGLQRRRMR